MGVAAAILAGQLFVNVPALIVIVGLGAAGLILAGFASKGLPRWVFWPGIAALIVSPLAGWAWWSFSVPRWRRWALRNGVPERELYKWGVMMGLVWPKGSKFEKTEFRLKD